MLQTCTSNPSAKRIKCRKCHLDFSSFSFMAIHLMRKHDDPQGKDTLILDTTASAQTPLLSSPTPHGPRLITQSELKDTMSVLGLPKNNYSGHSFRRGGASWALQAGRPGEVIQILGDWKSDTYKEYLHLNTQTKFHFMSLFCNKLPVISSSTTTPTPTP